MAKRISDLTEQTIADSTYVMEVEKPDGSTPETEKITIADVVSIGGAVIENTVQSTSIASSISTPTDVIARYINIGNSTTISMSFTLDFSGTNPQFTLGDIPNAALLVNQAASCVVVGLDAGVYACRLTSVSPTTFTVSGVFSTSGTRGFVINATLL